MVRRGKVSGHMGRESGGYQAQKTRGTNPLPQEASFEKSQ
jgi:hypothetical protein